jgi:L-rhamnose isomerase/sugar isomerase
MSAGMDDGLIAEQNTPHLATLEQDYEHLGRQLARRGLDIERQTKRAMRFEVAVPS